jgi:transmembrane sensor
MTQYDFDKLLEKYLQGGCSPEEELLLDEWANRQMNTDTTILTPEDAKSVKKHLWKRIRQKIAPHVFFNLWTKFSIAAAVLLLFYGVSMWQRESFFSKTPALSGTSPTGMEMTNTTAKPQTITLNDGSTIVLQPNSAITYPEKFGDHDRIVYLKGEGFFDISRDTTKPFYVYAGDLVTEVLGTSFTVKSYETDKTAEVVVATGKVMVYSIPPHSNQEEHKNERQSTVLKPNQKIIFEKTTRQIKARLVESPVVLNPPKTTTFFLFQEEPLFEVLHNIEMAYGLTIIPASALQNCVFTGDLNDLTLNEQLTVICHSINATFEQQETHILIKGAGCE